MVCRNFILPEFCKPCLFLFSSQFAKLIVHYLQTVADLCTDRRLFGAPLSGFSDPWGHARCQWANCFVDGKPLSKHANMVIVRNMMNKQNMNDNWDMFCEKLIDMGVHKIMLAGLKKVGRANENLEKIALTPLEYQSLIDRLKESKVITGINDEYRKLAGDEAESNIRIDIPVPYSGVCPYVYQDENPVPISPRIATNGDVYLCQSFMDQRYCLGNINKDSLPHALFNENFINLVNFMTTGRFYMDDCNKCVLKYQCPRGCIGDCLANGSIHETDGGCFFRKENAIRQLLKQSEAIVAEHMQF